MEGVPMMNLYSRFAFYILFATACLTPAVSARTAAIRITEYQVSLAPAIPSEAQRNDKNPSGEQLLLAQIRRGETLYRDDIVNDAVTRLYRIQPDHPEGLLAQVRIAARLDRMEEARRLLTRLQKASPESGAARTAQLLITLTEADAIAALTQGRLYSAVGRVDEAIVIYDELLQGIYPTADLTLEYWQLYARQPGRRPEAIQKLQASLERYPDHAPTLLVVASMLFSEDQPDEARQYLRRLARLDTHRDIAASREYDYLSTLNISAENRALWQDFVDTYEGLDAGARGREQLARFDAKLNDPAWQAGRQGVALIEQGQGQTALALLQQAVAAYPDDVEFLGSLGIAYLRVGNRTRALHYFEQAIQKEPRVDRTYRWVSLMRSTQYWMLLEQASRALEDKNWNHAGRLYRQAQQLQPDNPFAVVGLADVAMTTGNDEAAWRYYRQALRLDPAAGVARRGVLRYLDSKPPQEALARLDTLALDDTSFADLRRRLNVRILRDEADAAMADQRWEDAATALQQAQELDPDDPWLSYALARSLREHGQAADGLAAFQRHLNRHRGEPASHYAHGLLLSAMDRWQDTRDTLAIVPLSLWDARMHELEDRVVDAQLIARAQEYRAAGRGDAAIALLEQRPGSVRLRVQVADWSREDGNYPKALSNYNAVLRMDDSNFQARLGRLETWQAQGKADAVQFALRQPDFDFQEQSTSAHRRVAALWQELGDAERARHILQQRTRGLTEAEPLLYRDLARLTRDRDPEAALDLYAHAMRDADLLPAKAVQPQRDNVAFTRAMRVEDSDTWLERGVRREAEALYQRENPVLTIQNDAWGRRDGTPGMSRLHANTTMVQLDYPIRQGRGFIRADHVRLDAGTLEADGDGIYRGNFGRCSFSAASMPDGWQGSPDCRSGLKQRAHGTSAAVGWQGERLSFDLGTTPMGFAITNWTGGISYTGKTGLTGWRVTASRRPMSNSLLSFAGARDPATGTTWGGVMATGGALTLSWDQGEANGVWADISHHRLSGRHVDDNHRTRLMGGYYRRLINKDNEQLSAGVNLMYWRYHKNLGDYGFGQGGYYSPRRYTSVSLPVSYAKRSGNWSFILDGSVSRSFVRSDRNTDGRSSGTGYRLGAFVERRLNSHWVLGGGIDHRRSKDYSPSHFTLYLRYSFKPWQGSLPLAPSPMIPYADFK